MVPEIATLDTAYGQLQLWSNAPAGFMEIMFKRHGNYVGSVPLTREQAESMGRLMLAHATGPRPIGDVLAPVLQRAGVTRDMLVEDAEIVAGGSR